jgi:glucokinase
MSVLKRTIEPAPRPQLVADIGGTHARFALVEAGTEKLVHARTFKTSDFDGLVEAVEHYLESFTGPRPSSACMAVACPVVGDDISLTNNDWAFSTEDVRKQLALDNLSIVNDFRALAAAVPYLEGEQLVQIGGGEARPNSPCTVVGPGTGLGLANMVFDNGKTLILEGEGGHVGFAPHDERELEVWRILSRQYGRVSAERILSGAGLVDLHRALALIDGQDEPKLEPAAIIESSEPRCRETVLIFSAILGSFAADVALMIGSFGGVYVGGGIAPRMRLVLEIGPFRARFEDKGRMSKLVRKIPTFLITADNPALHGAALLLNKYSNQGDENVFINS